MDRDRVSCAGDRACVLPVCRDGMCRQHLLMLRDVYPFERNQR